jgi:hypothetical protein
MIKKYIFLTLLIITANIRSKSAKSTAPKAIANSVNIKKRAQILLTARKAGKGPYRINNRPTIVVHRPNNTVFQDLPDFEDDDFAKENFMGSLP